MSSPNSSHAPNAPSRGTKSGDFHFESEFDSTCQHAAARSLRVSNQVENHLVKYAAIWSRDDFPVCLVNFRSYPASRWHVGLWAAFFGLLFVTSPVATTAFGEKNRVPAKWAVLEYAYKNWLGGDALTVRLMPGDNFAFPTEVGLKVDLQWLVGNGDQKDFEDLKLRLHYPDGRVVDSVKESGPFVVTAGVLVTGRSFVFPFGDNALTEAWFELRAGGQTFWLEVPYGFPRNPEDPMPPSDPNGKPQGYAPAMTPMKKEDDIVRWNNVQYRFGTIQNGWDLEVNIAHRGPIRCVTKLRRPDGRWAIHTPAISVRVDKDNGGAILGEHISSRLESPTCREDEFEFAFDPLAGRSWADLIVTVDGVPQTRAISLGTFLEGMWVPPSSP